MSNTSTIHSATQTLDNLVNQANHPTGSALVGSVSLTHSERNGPSGHGHRLTQATGYKNLSSAMTYERIENPLEGSHRLDATFNIGKHAITANIIKAPGTSEAKVRVGSRELPLGRLAALAAGVITSVAARRLRRDAKVPRVPHQAA